MGNDSSPPSFSSDEEERGKKRSLPIRLQAFFRFLLVVVIFEMARNQSGRISNVALPSPWPLQHVG